MGKNLSSQLIQSAYGYAGIELLPIFQVADTNSPERIVTPEPRRINIENKKPAKPGFMQNLQLNDKYTFDNFVQGEGNKLAAGAALAVADSPGVSIILCSSLEV